MTFRRKRASFSRGRRSRGNKYEMQNCMINGIVFEPDVTTTFNLPRVDLFLIAHPRMEWATDPTNGFDRVPPLARGIVVKGIRHKVLFGFGPVLDAAPQASQIGFCSIKWAIQRLPSSPDTLAPLVVPNLFSRGDAVTGVASDTIESVRTMYQNLQWLTVVDGSMTTDLATRSTLENTFVRDPRAQWELSHVKTACRLSMDQGLYINIQSVNPFDAQSEGSAIALSMQADFRFGVKQLISGPNVYV